MKGDGGDDRAGIDGVGHAVATKIGRKLPLISKGVAREKRSQFVDTKSLSPNSLPIIAGENCRMLAVDNSCVDTDTVM